MSDKKAVRRYLQATAIELAGELSECADNLETDAVGNTDAAELIEALSMAIDGITETAHQYSKRLDGLNEQYLRCFA